jgi:hypothetical protein
MEVKESRTIGFFHFLFCISRLCRVFCQVKENIVLDVSKLHGIVIVMYVNFQDCTCATLYMNLRKTVYVCVCMCYLLVPVAVRSKA